MTDWPRNPRLLAGAEPQRAAVTGQLILDPTSKLAAAIEKLASALERLADKKAETI